MISDVAEALGYRAYVWTVKLDFIAQATDYELLPDAIESTSEVAMMHWVFKELVA